MKQNSSIFTDPDIKKSINSVLENPANVPSEAFSLWVDSKQDGTAGPEEEESCCCWSSLYYTNLLSGLWGLNIYAVIQPIKPSSFDVF